MPKNKEPQSPPKSDDRNVIEGGATDLESLEHQVAIVWEKYQKQIFIAIAAIFVVFLGVKGIQFAAKQAELSMQDGYATASDKEAWADSEEGHALSGFAYKELADEAYANSDFAKSVELYENAAASTKSAVQQAALIGQAMSLLALNKTDDAKSIFLQVASEDNVSSKPEAQYRLASLALKAENFDEARGLIDSILQSGQQTIWMQKARFLQSSLPAVEEFSGSEN